MREVVHPVILFDRGLSGYYLLLLHHLGLKMDWTSGCEVLMEDVGTEIGGLRHFPSSEKSRVYGTGHIMSCQGLSTSPQDGRGLVKLVAHAYHSAHNDFARITNENV